MKPTESEVWVKVPVSERFIRDGDVVQTNLGMLIYEGNGKFINIKQNQVTPSYLLEKQSRIVLTPEELREHEKAAIDSIIQPETSWSLIHVLEKLLEASDILLHKKDYDGHGWEEHEGAFIRGKELLKNINEIYLNQLK